MCWFAAPVAAGAASAATATSAATYAAIAASVLSAAVGGYAAYQSGQSQKKAGEFNAKMQERSARDATERGNIEASERRDAARRLGGTQAAVYGAQGLDLQQGTPLDVLSETRGMGELDALRTINNAQRTASGMNAQAEIERYTGRAAGRGGTMSAAGTLLAGASNSYGRYVQLKG